MSRPSPLTLDQTLLSSFYQDVFVSKLDLATNNLLYGTYLGVAAEDEDTAIAIDGSGIATLTGYV